MMLFLQGHGVSAAYSTRIYKTYGQEAVRVVQENPYRRAQDVRGIGFITADKIDRQMGIDEHSPHRAQATLEHLLLERAGEGHVFVPNAELLDLCQSRYDIPEELLRVAVGSLREAGRIVLDGEAVFLRGLYLAERAVADSIRALVGSPGQRREFDTPAAVEWASRRMGVELTGEQRQAVHEAVSQKVFVLTGGPGTGKTTKLSAVISVFDALGKRVALAAPTGRAAKRLGEAAGREAQTLHRLLEFKPGEGRSRTAASFRWKKNRCCSASARAGISIFPGEQKHGWAVKPTSKHTGASVQPAPVPWSNSPVGFPEWATSFRSSHPLRCHSRGREREPSRTLRSRPPPLLRIPNWRWPLRRSRQR